MIKSFFITLLLVILSACQSPPTKVVEKDLDFEKRSFGKLKFGEKFELNKSVIIDVRPRFDHELSKPPRSFNVYWKDWDLRGYRGQGLKKKRLELQRLLSLQGVDQYSRIVILGNGLKGQGEEFLVAATLLNLGLQKINFVSNDQMRKAYTAKNVPPLENIPYWSQDVVYDYNCKEGAQGDVFISKKSVSKKSYSFKPSDLFNKSLKIKRVRLPKSMNPQISSPGSLWAYGLAISLRKNEGRRPCVVFE